MEKISIARRCLEKRKLLFSMKPDPILSSPKIETHALDGLSCSLGSLLLEKISVLQTGRRQFTVEIISGLEKPLKMLVSLEPMNCSNSSDQNFLTIEEAARIYQVSKGTIYRQIQQGSLQGLKIGRKWRVFSNSLKYRIAES